MMRIRPSLYHFYVESNAYSCYESPRMHDHRMRSIIQSPSTWLAVASSSLQSIFFHGFLQCSLCRIFRLLQERLWHMLMEAIGFRTNPSHLEFKVAVLVVVVYKMCAARQNFQFKRPRCKRNLESLHSSDFHYSLFDGDVSQVQFFQLCLC